MIDKIKIIVGLGNPGKEYKETYHNVGQEFLFFLAKTQRFSAIHPLFSGREITLGDQGQKIWLVQPKTFMNDSGSAVLSALKHFHATPDSLLVAHDEMDIPLGEFKISTNRGSAGHHGVDSIIQHLKTKNFSRIRLGIGLPNKKAEEIVLRPLNNQNKKILYGVFEGVQEKLIEKT